MGAFHKTHITRGFECKTEYDGELVFGDWEKNLLRDQEVDVDGFGS